MLGKPAECGEILITSHMMGQLYTSMALNASISSLGCVSQVQASDSQWLPRTSTGMATIRFPIRDMWRSMREPARSP